MLVSLKDNRQCHGKQHDKEQFGEFGPQMTIHAWRHVLQFLRSQWLLQERPGSRGHLHVTVRVMNIGLHGPVLPVNFQRSKVALHKE